MADAPPSGTPSKASAGAAQPSTSAAATPKIPTYDFLSLLNHGCTAPSLVYADEEVPTMHLRGLIYEPRSASLVALTRNEGPHMEEKDENTYRRKLHDHPWAFIHRLLGATVVAGSSPAKRAVLRPGHSLDEAASIEALQVHANPYDQVENTWPLSYQLRLRSWCATLEGQLIVAMALEHRPRAFLVRIPLDDGFSNQETLIGERDMTYQAELVSSAEHNRFFIAPNGVQMGLGNMQLAALNVSDCGRATRVERNYNLEFETVAQPAGLSLPLSIALHRDGRGPYMGCLYHTDGSTELIYLVTLRHAQNAYFWLHTVKIPLRDDSRTDGRTDVLRTTFRFRTLEWWRMVQCGVGSPLVAAWQDERIGIIDITTGSVISIIKMRREMPMPHERPLARPTSALTKAKATPSAAAAAPPPRPGDMVPLAPTGDLVLINAMCWGPGVLCVAITRLMKGEEVQSVVRLLVTPVTWQHARRHQLVSVKYLRIPRALALMRWRGIQQATDPLSNDAGSTPALYLLWSELPLEVFELIIERVWDACSRAVLLAPRYPPA